MIVSDKICEVCPFNEECISDAVLLMEFLKKYAAMIHTIEMDEVIKAAESFISEPDEEKHIKLGMLTLAALKSQVDLIFKIREEFGQLAPRFGFVRSSEDSEDSEDSETLKNSERFREFEEALN